VIPVAGKEQLGKFIQALNPGDFAAIQFDFRCGYLFHPGLLDQNMAFHAMMRNLLMLKFFSVKICGSAKMCDLPKTLQFQ
jgi:hypothetical protein